MSRLTNQSYLIRRKQLQASWLDDGSFSLLTHNEQWDLHTYFLPTIRISDTELLEHREDISFLDRSLPQRAGRAFTHLNLMRQARERYLVATKPKVKKGQATDHEFHAISEVHPHLDPNQMAKILLVYKARTSKDSS